jgi:hypothetical protein
MSIRKEIRRGVGNQPRQIDAKRRERARALSSQKDLGSEFTTDAQGKLRLKADQLGLASKADVEDLAAKLDNIAKAQAATENS